MSKQLTIQEAAKELGVSVKTIRRWEKAGRITSKRTAGGHRRFDVEELTDQARENQRQYFSSLQVILAILTTLIATAFITNIAVARHAQQKRQQIIEKVVHSLNNPSNRQFGVVTDQEIDTSPGENDSGTAESDLLEALGGEKLEEADTDSPDTSALVPPINKNAVESGIGVIPRDDSVSFVVFAGLVEGDLANVTPTSDLSSTLAVADYVEGAGFLVTRLDDNRNEVYFNWTLYR